MSVAVQNEPKDGQATGLVCPNCGCRHFFVVWVRHHFRKTVRCRECRHCGRRVRTYERIWGE